MIDACFQYLDEFSEKKNNMEVTGIIPEETSVRIIPGGNQNINF